MERAIFLVSGVPGAGKSTVATALMRRFPLGLHIPVDDLREWVVSGIAHPVPVWTDETTRQFSLARQVAAHAAQVYLDAGFAVAIDDVIFPIETQYTSALSSYPLRKVFLAADLQTLLARNAARTNKTFDTSALSDTIRDLHASMHPADFERAGWTVLDTTHMSLEQTVDAILG